MSKDIEMTSYEMELAYHGLKCLLESGDHFPFTPDEIKALMEKIREAHNERVG